MHIFTVWEVFQVFEDLSNLAPTKSINDKILWSNNNILPIFQTEFNKMTSLAKMTNLAINLSCFRCWISIVVLFVEKTPAKRFFNSILISASLIQPISRFINCLFVVNFCGCSVWEMTENYHLSAPYLS